MILFTMWMRKAGPTSSRFRVDALDFFDQVYAISQDAIKVPQAVTYTFLVATLTIRVVFCNQRLADQMTPALRHLVIKDNPAAAFTIYAWDSESTQTAMPDAVWSADAIQVQGRIDGFDNERIQAAFLPLTDGFAIVDFERNIGLHRVQNAQTISIHQRSYPFRTLISWWAMRRNLVFAHGAAVGLKDAGVLIAGPSGSGKSTSALACLGSDLLYVSDDHVLLSDQPYAHGLYQSAKLRREQFDRFPTLRAHVVPDQPPDDKALLFLDEIAPGQVTSGLPLRAFLVPRVTGERDTSIHQTSSAKVMMSLAPSSLFLIPVEQQIAFRKLAEMVRKVPSFEIRLGTDLDQIPEQIHSFITGSLL